MARKSNNNYDILDKILSEAGIPERQGGNQWVADPNHPDGGYMVTTPEDWEDLKRSIDQLEKKLRS